MSRDTDAAAAFPSAIFMPPADGRWYRKLRRSQHDHGSTAAEERMSCLTIPLVSIVMPSLHKRRYLIERINCILTQPYSNWELIIIDFKVCPSGDRAAWAATIREPSPHEHG